MCLLEKGLCAFYLAGYFIWQANSVLKQEGSERTLPLNAPVSAFGAA
jgi:hypothetical protein